MGLIVFSAVLGIICFVLAAVAASCKEVGIAAGVFVFGVFLLLVSSLLVYDYAQPTVPTDIASMKGQSFFLVGKVQVDNACGKYAVVARKEDGSLVDFCTSQNVPDGIFKVTGDPKNLYVPYVPFADSNQALSASPAPSH